MTLPKVAAIQMVSGYDLAVNLATAESLVIEAAEAGAKLVVLPETFALMGIQQAALGQQEVSQNAIVRPFMAKLAHRLQLWIVAGTIPLAVKNNKRVHSACLIVDDRGVERGCYHKMHLFDADVADNLGQYRESETFLAGDSIQVIDTPVGRLGVAVCYDIRFPELFRLMFDVGVDIIAVPAAFTLLTGKAHWLPLLRARAIENQCYIIGANQGGTHSKARTTSGGSVIIDGWGEVLAVAGMGESIVVAEIDLARLQQQRAAMPVANHRRYTVSKLAKE